MNTFAVLALFALVAYVAAVPASPCKEVCDGTCEISNQGVGVAVPALKPFVTTNVAVCKQTCGVTCGCIDQCNAACGPRLAACRGQGNDLNPIVQSSCMAQFSICSTTCGVTCVVSRAAGIARVLTTPPKPPQAG